ncbi:DUF4252 domain-containing protein [Puia dinghuensis]|uniref:DUF4252 domain-containing protein n=1 Tax=Puia dinghuensis TaxID=1792502 RepID=A0A8J2UCI6_9BACT|nr:DUF4252 domain-containing protein [Puia dinghuensis]GGA98898.1 hypothetical protein GCM10011511_22790 [Puia dinghuensis]
MKSLLLPALCLLLTFAACAQPTHLDKFFQHYNSNGQQLPVDPGLLLNISCSGNKINTLHCLIIDGKKNPDAAREFRDLEQSLRADHFEEWFSIRKGKGRIQLLSLDGKDNVEDMVCLIVGDDDSGLFFHLRGHFTEEDKARIEAALQQHDSE